MADNEQKVSLDAGEEVKVKAEQDPMEQAKAADKAPEPVEEKRPSEPSLGAQATEDTAPAAGADVPDREWVKTADLHLGSEEGQPEATEEKLKAVQDAQPEYGVGPDQVAQIEEVERVKRQTAEDAAKPLRGLDFEVGGEEENYLPSGVPAEHGETERQKNLARVRRAANAYASDKERADDDALLGDDKS